MDINISKELKHTFDLATLRKKTKGLRTPIDWEKGHKIMNHYKRETQKQSQLYYAQYDARVNQALRRIIDKAGAKNRDFTHRWFGTDNFNKDHLMQQAHRVVQRDHHRRITSN